MTRQAGAQFGPYVIQSLIGEGGMGEVYRAHDPRLDRVVAIKFSKRDFDGRFEREARAAASLNHANVAQVYDVGQNYIVMEYVDGEPIRGPLTPGRLLDIAIQIAEGLGVAHAAGLVHRDLKPENILVTRDNRVKILDFGIAKRLASSAASVDSTETLRITTPGAITGTVAYMSPEQVRGENVDARSDLFSFGLILCELLTGVHPFARPTSIETMHAILKDDPPELPSSVASALQRIVMRALQKNPEDRFQSARDLAFALKLSAGLGGSPTTTSQTRRSRWKPFAVAAVVVSVCGAAFTLYMKRPPSHPTAELQYTPFAAERCNETDPAWSPDGKSIAYVCKVDGVGHVFTRALDAPQAAQITTGNIDAFWPFWSADGSRIYFQAGQDLYFVSSIGSAPQLLLRDAAAAALSPDGLRLVFFRRADRSLFFANTDGSNATRLKAEGMPESYRAAVARFSPDGTNLAALILTADEADVSRQLWVVPLNGARPFRSKTNWIGYAIGFGAPVWTRDGRHVLAPLTPANASPSAGLPRDMAGQAHLYELDVFTGEQRAITSGPLSEIYPAIAPNGNRIAVTIEAHDTDIYEYGVERGSGRPLMAGSREEYGAQWSPSGQEFAYVSELDGKLRVCFRGPNGPSRVLPLSGSPVENIRVLNFSPDGSRLALDSYGKPHRVVLVPTAGGVPIPIDSTGNKDTHGATFSPDGAWIAYTRYRRQPGPLNVGWITKVSSSGGQPVDVVAVNQGPGFSIQWSPANNGIAYSTAGGELSMTSIDGKSQRVLSKSSYAAWTFDRQGSHIYGLRRGEGRKWQVWRIDAVSGVERRIVVLDTPVDVELRTLSMHPDAKRFLATYTTSSSDIWLIDRTPD